LEATLNTLISSIKNLINICHLKAYFLSLFLVASTGNNKLYIMIYLLEFILVFNILFINKKTATKKNITTILVCFYVERVKEITYDFTVF
jgi:hypothetical protein